MKKWIWVLTLIFAFVVASCQSTTETSNEQCEITLSTLELQGANFTGVEMGSVTNAPLPGNISGEEMRFDTGSLVLSRYESAETAAELLTEATIKATFSEDVTIVTDAPVVMGDETVWIRLQAEPSIVDAAIVRYSDYLMLANPQATTDIVADMLDVVNGVVVDYIDAHPECAYMHPNTR